MNQVFLTGLIVGFLSIGSLPEAQAQNVLKNAEVTEAALIDALAIESPASAASVASAASGVRTRGFRPVVRASAPAQPTNPHAGKASLLITFPTNSADLSAETKGILEKLARALQSDRLAGFSFRVEGHADSRGDLDRNLKLSQQRAESVSGYLVSNFGVLPERLTAVGKGSSELMNQAQIDAPENRRVTIVTIKE